jgi:hypothetical protein
MRDPDISRQLERRASGEWQPGRVMSAVCRAMDEPRTERVETPRWAAVAALVGLVGVLIVLAVALPRLDLGPAAPSPTPPGVSTPAPVTSVPETPPAEAPPGLLTCRPYVMAGTDRSPGVVYPSLDIQLSDQTHTVVDCAYFSEFATLPEGPLVQSRWHDVDELGLTWNVARTCPSSPRLELGLEGDRYIVTVEQGEIEDCGAAPGRQAVVIWFDGPAERSVDASMVGGEPVPPDQPTPTPPA